MQAARAIQQQVEAYELAYNAETYHLNQQYHVGYASAEALQYIFGGEIVKGVAKGAQMVCKGVRGIAEVSHLGKIPVGRRGNPLKIITKNAPQKIDGTNFTGHALDQMQSRGILAPSAVIDIVKNPSHSFPGNIPGTTVFIRDNLKVITNEAGDIITVIPQ